MRAGFGVIDDLVCKARALFLIHIDATTGALNYQRQCDFAARRHAITGEIYC